MTYTLASEVMDWLGAIGGIIAIVGTPIGIWIAVRANSHSREANRIAQEALDLQKQQGEVNLIVEISPEYADSSQPADPLKTIIVATIRNDGPIDARIADIYVDNGSGGYRHGLLWGDHDPEKHMTDTPLPVTLRPGRTCHYKFLRAYVDRQHPLTAQSEVPDYTVYHCSNWMGSAQVVVQASNKTFKSQNNTLFANLRAALKRVFDEDQLRQQAETIRKNDALNEKLAKFGMGTNLLLRRPGT